MILRLPVQLLILYLLFLISSCRSQSFDDESKALYEGSGHLANPDDEDSVVEVT